MEFIFRTIKPADAPVLKNFIKLAMSPNLEKDAEIQEKPEWNVYVEDWGKAADIGFIIETKKERKPIGAAWFRQFEKKRAGFGFVDEKIPELVVAVVPEFRDRGLGRQLLTRLIHQAQLEGFPGLSISVYRSNPVLAFYERLDFQKVREEGDLLVLCRRF